MNSTSLHEITDDDIARYHRDGVVLLKNMFDSDWITHLNDGLTANCDAPSSRSRIWDRDSDGRTMFYDSQAWQGIREYQDFIFKSPAASISANLMGSREINFYFDAVFIRSAGSQFETPWHQDEPYWSVEGYDTCTLWMPLTQVKSANALAFVPGSHRLDTMFDQYNFGNLNPDGQRDVDQIDYSSIAQSAFPDINDNPARYGVVSWDMQPGDCVVFNSRIMHGGSGKLDSDRDLRVFTSKWLGDDVKIKFREGGMDPDHSAVMMQQGLQSGDRPGTDLYPRVREAERT